VGARQEGRKAVSGVRITAIVSSFERPKGLRRTLESVQTQTTRGEMEVIVCDDASRCTEVGRVLEEFAGRGAVVIAGERRPVEHKEVYCTFTDLINRALDRAKGEYLSYITDGNEWTPGRCEHYAAFLDANPEVFLVWGMVQNVRDGEPLPMPAYGQMRMADIVQRIHWGNFIDHGSVMHRRTHLRWSTDPKSWRFADWLFWQRLLDGGMQFANVPFHGEMFYSDKDSLGRCLVERNEKFKVMYERRFGVAKAGDQARKEEDMSDEVKKVEYAKNVGGKIEIVPDPGGGKAEEVPPGGIIKKSKVTTSDGMLWPAFAPHAEYPEYKPKEPKAPKGKKGARRRRPSKQPSSGRKVPFDRMRETVESAERKAAEMETAPEPQEAPQKATASKGKGRARGKGRKASRSKKKASGRGKKKGK
jgi:glycosyltransferase involved in cell wall biosynthesis